MYIKENWLALFFFIIPASKIFFNQLQIKSTVAWNKLEADNKFTVASSCHNDHKPLLAPIPLPLLQCGRSLYTWFPWHHCMLPLHTCMCKYLNSNRQPCTVCFYSRQRAALWRPSAQTACGWCGHTAHCLQAGLSLSSCSAVMSAFLLESGSHSERWAGVAARSWKECFWWAGLVLCEWSSPVAPRQHRI